MFRLLLRIMIGIIQIPLTILYFVISLIGGILSGAGWIVGVIVFMITGICWLFGQFDAWYQPLICIGISTIIVFCPVILCDALQNMILVVKNYFLGINNKI